MAVLLNLALALLLAAQSPNLPPDLRNQAISLATYVIQQSQTESVSPIATSTPIVPVETFSVPAPTTCIPTISIQQSAPVLTPWNNPNTRIERFRMTPKVGGCDDLIVSYSGYYSFSSSSAPVFDYGNATDGQVISFLNPFPGTYTVDFVAHNKDYSEKSSTTSISFTSHGLTD